MGYSLRVRLAASALQSEHRREAETLFKRFKLRSLFGEHFRCKLVGRWVAASYAGACAAESFSFLKMFRGIHHTSSAMSL